MPPRSRRRGPAPCTLSLLCGALPAAARGPDRLELASAAVGETRQVEVTLLAS